MKLRLLPILICLLPFATNAAIPYRSEKVGNTPDKTLGGDSEYLARQYRVYVGGSYNLSMWQNGADDTVSVTGKNTSSFEGVIGLHIYDTFRLEANYYKMKADWNAFKMSGDTVFVNAIFDARIDNLYRVFHSQVLVPYVGFGAGMSWNTVDDNVTIENKISPAMAALAGIGIEMGDRFALDFGYRYFYLFSPNFNLIKNFDPTAHQFRIGMRVNF
ncbi:MAG TPA: outer membrane beta-barrel protein [Alphaproteobacteria bacterium]|nr:outer membrane beta-barrel protein [Alphaproteobacteria bacterium]